MNTFLEILKIIFKLLFPIIIIVLVLTIINIIINFHKYGKNIFSSLKKRNNIGEVKDLVINMLNNETIEKIMIVTRDNNSFYAITDYGIFAILIIEVEGILSGKSADKYLYFKSDKLSKEFLNPIPSFIQDNNKIRMREIELNEAYIKARKNCKLMIDDIDSKYIYTLKDFCYSIYQLQHSSVKYSEEEKFKFYKIIEGVINGHN